MPSQPFARGAALALLALSVVSFAAGCGRKDSTTTDSTTISDAAAATTGAMDSGAGTLATGSLTDAQIARVAQTANSLDSMAAANALPKLTRADARKFAQQMVSDHGMLNRSINDLAQRLAITPQVSDLSTSIERDAASMSPIGTGAAYDRSYLDNEVTMHQKVLQTIDETLIPQAKNADLKTLLQQARETVSGHLQSAQQLVNVAAGGAQ